MAGVTKRLKVVLVPHIATTVDWFDVVSHIRFHQFAAVSVPFAIRVPLPVQRTDALPSCRLIQGMVIRSLVICLTCNAVLFRCSLARITVLFGWFRQLAGHEPEH